MKKKTSGNHAQIYKHISGLNNFKILIAEDNKTNRLLMTEIIHDFEGVEVIEAENGEEAVRLAIKEKPDLIIMDLMMPVMNGYEATARLKQNKKTQHIPVIAWTAKGIKDEEIRMHKGFHSLLRKPSSIKKVKEAIAAFLLN